MSYFQLLNFVILLALLSSSDGYKVQKNNNIVRRRSRDAVLKNETQTLLNKVLSDERQTDAQLTASIQSDQTNAHEITQNILAAANQMANAGATDIKSADQWTKIQGELQKAINLIIAAYRKFKGFHEQVCTQISNYAQNMVNKYGRELTALSQMSAPPLTTARDDPIWMQFFSKYPNMMSYARAHQTTLQTATDCTADLINRTMIQRTTILNPPITDTVVVQIPPPTYVTYDAQSMNIPCTSLVGDNGNQICSNGLADTTLRYANDVCSCVTTNQYMLSFPNRK